MRVGIPKEVKAQESRVSTVPMTVAELVRRGHQVFVEKNAGVGCGFMDPDYQAAGATIVKQAHTLFEKSQLIIKVKEPQPNEIPLLGPEHVLFTYLHLAADAALTTSLRDSGCTAIAYETIDVNGRLPLLEPMSEIAGRMSAIYGAAMLAKHHQGSGVLLPGVPGVPSGKVMVLGGGTAGANAARIAHGLGAEVTVLDVNTERLRWLDTTLPGVRSFYSTPEHIEELLPATDLVIGSVLVAGGAAPKLIRREHLKLMKPGSVIVDIAIDQGGCCETSRPTTHEDPVFLEEGIVHYCVTNMPGAYARTSTEALSHAVRPWKLALADMGVSEACHAMPELWHGINCMRGDLTCEAVAQAHGLSWRDPRSI